MMRDPIEYFLSAEITLSDKLLEVLAKEQPQIHLLSAAGEQMLQKKEAEKPPQKVSETRVSSVFFLSAQTGPRSGR